MPHLRPLRPVTFALAGLAFAANDACRAEGPETKIELAPIQVVANTPLAGMELPADLAPTHAQALTSNQLDRAPGNDLASLLQSSLGGVGLSPAQGNPYQNDLFFRGFAASPLLGMPQGLSVYLDGVRINEGFGDTLNWDLLPPNALAKVTLLPGSPPAFGLNTLGGALSIETRDGRDGPGLTGSLQAGSFGRRGARLDYGAQDAGQDFFWAANQLHETGWRQHTATELHQAFAKWGWREGSRELEVSLLGADNRLEGGQTLPLEMLPQPQQSYTWPDQNRNRLAALTARAIWQSKASSRWDVLAYARRLKGGNRSSNVNHEIEDHPQPGEPEGSLDRSALSSLGLGASMQWSHLASWGKRRNRLAIGTSLDWGRSRYQLTSVAGRFTADRGLSPDGEEAVEVSAGTRHLYHGIYFSDTLSLDPHWHLHASARRNVARINLRDRSGEVPELDGDHRFARLNPALGVNYRASEQWAAHLGYNEGMRVATAMELGCADPAAPCKLPSAFLADPPLRPVIARSIEAGLRLRLAPGAELNLAAYRTALRDDILFVASQSSHSGYFQNVPRGLRQGLEAALRWRRPPWELAAFYHYTRASFESHFSLPSPANSEADAQGNIAVMPGYRVPGVPAQRLLLNLAYQPSEQWRLAASLLACGTQFARGDENNRDRFGRLPGYALLKIDAWWRLSAHWELMAQVDNLFNRRYQGFGILGENYFRGPDQHFAANLAQPSQFRAPGPPRSAWLSLRFSWPARP